MSRQERAIERLTLSGARYEWAAVALAVGAVNVTVMRCTEGLYGWGAVPAGLVGLALGWYALLRAPGLPPGRPNEGFAGLLVICLAVVLNTLFMLGIACSVLWTGHDPLLG